MFALAYNLLYDSTNKDFTYNDFTYNIHKCDITFMFFIYCFK